MKYNHGVSSSTLAPDTTLPFRRREWLTQNGWMIAANSTGFISLLTSMIVFTNAL